MRQSLALQVMKILLSLGASWLIVVKQSVLTTSALIASKADWCSAVQLEKNLQDSLVVGGVRKAVWSASLGRKIAM